MSRGIPQGITEIMAQSNAAIIVNKDAADRNFSLGECSLCLQQRQPHETNIALVLHTCRVQSTSGSRTSCTTTA